MLNKIEIFGLCGSLLVFISMCFNTNSFKGNLNMRIYNALGSVVLTVYGVYIASLTTILLNGVLGVVNVYYIFVALKMRKEGVKGLVKRQKTQRKHWKEYELKKKKQKNTKNKKNK